MTKDLLTDNPLLCTAMEIYFKSKITTFCNEIERPLPQEIINYLWNRTLENVRGFHYECTDMKIPRSQFWKEQIELEIEDACAEIEGYIHA